MAAYVIRRLLLAVPTLLGMTLVVFGVMAFSPGGIGPNLVNAEGQLRPDERRALEAYYNERYGLDRPLYVQYLRWLNKVSPVGFATRPRGEPGAGDMILPRPRVKWPDLGESIPRRRPVGDLIAEAAPVTLLLNAITLPITYVVAVVLGARAAQARGKLFDVASGTALLALWSFPVILAGVLSIGFLANEKYLRLFPTNGLHDLLAGQMAFLPRFTANGFERGYLLDFAWHLVLPVLCLTYGNFAFLAKLNRGAVLENIAADYARTARAKGLGERQVLYRHVFRNSLLPMITVAAAILPAMLSGALIVETIFGIDGMGKLQVDAVFQKDPELVLSTTLISGLLGLAGYLLSDVLYAVADPRVSYD